MDTPNWTEQVAVAQAELAAARTSLGAAVGADKGAAARQYDRAVAKLARLRLAATRASFEALHHVNVDALMNTPNSCNYVTHGPDGIADGGCLTFAQVYYLKTIWRNRARRAQMRS